MTLPDFNDIIGAHWTPRYIKKHFLDFYNMLMKYPEDLSWPERLYWYKHNINEYPTCCICGKRVSFHKADKYYHKYCSQICCGKGEDTKQKRIDTSIQKYGVKHFSNREKAKQTCLDKYGVENVSQVPDVINKKKQTCLDKYGCTCNLHSKKGKEIVEKTMMERYGVASYTEILNNDKNQKENIEKIKKSFRDNFIKNSNDIIRYNDDGSWEVKCNNPKCDLCKEKSFPIFSGMYFDRNKIGTELCTKLNPIHSNQSGLELKIKDLLDSNNIKYEERNRNILNGLELDIYIPDYQIAIECNGCYWHDINQKPKNYHLNKYLKCKEKGIQLISIWEDWIIKKPEIVSSLILSKFGIYKTRLYARQCDIKELNNEYTSFLQENHIQGKTNASIKLGLFYKDELVGVMTFSKRSKLSGGKNDNCWELTRFCTKLYTQIVGGADKLLKYFTRHFNPSKVISFSSNDISNGKLYEKLGFLKIKDVSNSYWYVNQKTYVRYHRTSFTKSRLKSLGFDISNKTENDIMKTLPFYKIYDSGHIGWVLMLIGKETENIE